MSGDLHAVRQARRLVPGIVGVPTKEGVGLYGARSLTPRKAQGLIRKGAKEAIEKVGKINPYVLKKPVRMEVAFERPLMAQYASQIPHVKRRDISTVAYTARDIIEAFQLFDVLSKIASYAKSEGGL